MTIVTVKSITGRLSGDQRAKLAETLTDAVLVPEVGQFAPAARAGFQVHFIDLPADHIAIGGKLASETKLDVMAIDVAVMDGAWPNEVRAEVIRRVLAAMAQACGVEAAPATWWVNFRVIDEGSWGSRGDVLSVLSLLESGVFTEDRKREILARLA